MSKFGFIKTTERFDSKPVPQMVKFQRQLVVIIACLLVLLLVPLTVFVTLAYKTDQTDELTNNFEHKEVVIDIVEEFDHAIKEDVAITNVGDVPAYIRFKLAISAIDEKGDTVALPITVIENGEKTYRGIELGDFAFTASNWEENFFEVDGIYYNDTLVPVGDSVALFDEALFDVDLLGVDLVLPIVDASGNSYYIIEGNQLKSKADEKGNLIAYQESDLTSGQTALGGTVTYMSSAYTPVLTIVAESVQANGVEDAWGVTVNTNGTIRQTTVE